MKHLLLLLLVVLLIPDTRAQMTLEHTYQNSAALINTTASGTKYIISDGEENRVILYNSDHTEWKTIGLYIPDTCYLYTVQFVSDKLFNHDNKIELSYTWGHYNESEKFYSYTTRVINEEGIILADLPGVSYVSLYKTANNKIKYIAYAYNYAVSIYPTSTYVYNLPGQLSGTEAELSFPQPTLHIWPNPTSAILNISYEIPDNLNNGTLEIYNSQGQTVKTLSIKNKKGHLQIETAAYPQGLYYYKIFSNNNCYPGGKFIIQ